MKRQQVERFFQELSKRWKFQTRVLLLGGAEALVLGGTRPTLDVDFEVRFLSQKSSWEEFNKVAREASVHTGIGAQYAESVERWSQVTLLDYRRHTRLLGRFGTIEVRILDTEYWSIGKIARYWDQDIQDMLAVFQREKPDPLRVARVWAKAIAHSPRSTGLDLTKRQVLHFFRTFGKGIWGPSFDVKPIEKLFHPGSLSRQL